MRGEKYHRGVWIGLILSALMHTGVGIVAAKIPMARGDGDRLGSLGGGVLALNQPDTEMVLPPADDEDLRRAEEALRNQPPPEATPPPPGPPTPPPPPLVQREMPHLILGLENSDQITENWLGSADPTPHSAKLSDVNQSQLDTDPGDPGAKSGPGAMGVLGPVAPDQMPTPSEAKPEEKHLKAPEVKAREGEAAGGDEAIQGAKPDDKGTADKTTQAMHGGAPDDHRDPSLPGPPAKPASRIERGEDNGANDRTDIARASRPVKAIKPKEGSEGDSNENLAGSPTKPSKPADKPAISPTAPSAMPGNTSAEHGGGGEHAGEKSEKEADASSTTKAVEIRPGHPAAAQGLDITTKRPNFTRLTRVTAYPGNPLLKVTFNAQGIVTKVILLESSGVPDVDEPVINAIYEWKAKGKALAELTSADPDSGITFNVRILLR
jgi:hypothetical protein